MPSITSDGIMNGALAGFIAAINGYLPLLIFWGNRLLSAVVFIGFAYMLVGVMSNHNWYSMLMGLGWGVVRIAMVKVFLANLQDWGSAFPNAFQIIAANITGQSPDVLTPSGIYDLGLNIVAVMRSNFHWSGWFTHPLDDLGLWSLTPFVQLTWFAIACVYFAVLLETHWIVAKGAVTIIFASFDYGWGCLATWIVSLVQIGVRLLGVMMVLAIGLILTGGWTGTIDSMGTSFNLNTGQNALTQLLEAIILFYAVWALPRKAAGLIHSHTGGGVGAEGTGLENAVFEAGTAPYKAIAKAAEAGGKVAARAAIKAVKG
jgi:hypothetical protein